MKIQWQSRRFYPDLYGGSEVIGYEVVRRWRAKGVDVSVATENYGKRSLKYDEPIEGVRCVRIPTGGLGMFWRIGAVARVGRWIWHGRDIKKRYGISDVVFASNPECVVASKLICTGRCVIYRCEGITPYFLPILGRRVSRVFMAIEKMAMRSADAIVVASNIVKKQLVNYVDVDEEKVFVVPYGVDFERFSRSSDIVNDGSERCQFDKGDDFVIVCVGRLTREKGIDYLIEAFSGLKNRGRARLMIIGEGALEDELKGYAKQKGIADRVVFTGKVDSPEEYFARADVHVLMSRYETFGLAHLEAMASGLPTISWASRFPDSLVASSEIIVDGKTGYCIEPYRVDELRRVLDEMIENREMTRELGLRAREYVRERYSWDKTAERYLDIMKNVMK